MWCRVVVVSYLLFFGASEVLAVTVQLDTVFDLAKSRSVELKRVENQYKSNIAGIRAESSAVYPRAEFQTSWQRFRRKEMGPVPSEEHRFGRETSMQLTLSSPLYSFGRIDDLVESHHARKSWESLNKEQLTQNFYMKLVSAFAEAYLGQKNLSTASTALKHARAVFETTKSDFESGTRSQVDLLRAQAFLESARADHLRQAAEKTNAQSRLAAAVGLSSGESLVVQDVSLGAKFFQLAANKDPTSIQRSLLTQSLKSQTALHSYYQKTWLPAVSGFYSARSQATRFDDFEEPSLASSYYAPHIDHSIGVQVTWTLYEGGKDPAERARYIHQARSIGQSIEIHDREFQVKLAETDKNLETAKLVISAARKADDAAKLALKVAEESYQAGEMSLSTYLETQNEANNAQKQFAESVASYVRATAAWKLARRVPLEQVL